ncbi:hypothetical protein SLA2020_009460 [Shorea laevis]
MFHFRISLILNVHKVPDILDDILSLIIYDVLFVVTVHAALDAFNKDRASLPQPLPNPPPLASLPVAVPDPWTEEMINEKLKKAEDLAKAQLT